MISRQLIPTLLALPVCAQVPAETPPVKIVLQADPPPTGTLALDTAAIASSIQIFAHEEHLTTPPQESDGWIVGIRIQTQEEPDGVVVAESLLNLVKINHGKLADQSTASIKSFSAFKSVSVRDQTLCVDLVDRVRNLLTSNKVIPHKRPKDRATPFDSPTGVGPNNNIAEIDFAQVKIKNMPRQPRYPAYAKEHGIQGRVTVELTIGPDGIPIAARAEEGPDALLAYALIWSLRWTFEPQTINGHPETSKFKLRMLFNLQ